MRVMRASCVTSMSWLVALAAQAAPKVPSVVHPSLDTSTCSPLPSTNPAVDVDATSALRRALESEAYAFHARRIAAVAMRCATHVVVHHHWTSLDSKGRQRRVEPETVSFRKELKVPLERMTKGRAPRMR